MSVRVWFTATALVAAVAPSAVLQAPGVAHAAEVTTACPADVPRAGFSDVAPDDAHATSIDCVVWWGVARGVDTTRFAPAPAVTRGQAAALVAKTVRRSGGQLAAEPGDRLPGDEHSVHHFSINRMAAAGIVAGSQGEYRPDEPVTRAQLATVLVRAYEYRTGTALPPGQDAFADDRRSVHQDNINKAAAAGLTVGVGERRFLPDATVSRAQMATFASRMLQAVVEQGEVSDSPATLRAASALEDFGDCEELLGHLKERGLEEVGPYGWNGDFGTRFAGEVAGPTPVAASPASEQTGEGASAGRADSDRGSFSGTNNQEKDVDEADVVKTDGSTVWSVLRGRLRAVDVSGQTPREVGSLPLAEGHSSELLVAGTRALVLTTGYAEVRHNDSPEGIGRYRASSVLTWVDVTDPAAMRIDGTLRVDGATLAARMVDGVARVAVRSEAPDLGFTRPADWNEQAQQEAAQRNRLRVEESEIGQWLTRYRLEDLRPGQERTSEGALYGCDGLRRPPEYSGLGTVNVLTADLAGPPQAGRTTGVLAGGNLVYASAANLYVATTRWDWGTAASPDASSVTTEVHAFSLAEPTSAEYRASGKVDGVLLNQFAMSEHEGHLRVASTSVPPWREGEQDQSESFVSVLAQQGGALATVGRVGGLGRGEMVRGVRFVGDQGYVVTFRQTDPLYTLDLGDPAAPRVVGELKILGYSAYLHPVGDGLLLGVGQDADEEGTRRGAQLSLFDVSDPAQPTRLHQLPLGEGTDTDVEFDHRAFLHWPATGTTVLPISRYTHDEQAQTYEQFVGAVGIDVDVDDGLRPIREISHGEPSSDGRDRWPGIRRSLVVGDAVYTLSDLGLMQSDLDTLAERSFVEFAE